MEWIVNKRKKSINDRWKWEKEELGNCWSVNDWKEMNVNCQKRMKMENVNVLLFDWIMNKWNLFRWSSFRFFKSSCHSTNSSRKHFLNSSKLIFFLFFSSSLPKFSSLTNSNKNLLDQISKNEISLFSSQD